MVNCNNCQTKNSLDSKFCRNCGVGLPEDLLKAERENFEELLAEGYRKFSANETEEAFLIAQAAVQASPAHASAQSLLGMCYERKGDLAMALECYEQVLVLNPDSALDKIKVTQLRNSLSSHLLQEAAPTRKRAALAGVAAAVMLASLAGAVVAMRGNPAKTETQSVAMNGSAGAGAQGFEQTNRTVTSGPPGSGSTGAKNPGAPIANSNPNGENPEVRNDQGYTPRIGNSSGRTLPNPDGEITPVRIEGEIPNGPQPNRENTAPPPAPQDPDPEIKDDQGTKEPEKPKYDPGDIVIKRSQGGPRTNMGGGSDASQPSGTAQLVRSARESFQLGKFADAAKLYERAIREGGDAGSLNQRLGQCYERLGRRDEAIGAYRRAMEAFGNTAKSDPSGRAASALDSCRQAIAVLGG